MSTMMNSAMIGATSKIDHPKVNHGTFDEVL